MKLSQLIEELLELQKELKGKDLEVVFDDGWATYVIPTRYSFTPSHHECIIEIEEKG